MQETLRALVDGRPAAAISVSDRGLAYGDGLFETMAVVEGSVPLREMHLARLARGCARLGIAAPDATLLAAELDGLIDGADTGVAKLVLTRGGVARGYEAAADLAPVRILSLHPMPELEPACYDRGIAIRWCSTALGINPRLAGIKHLNRLEQVLARAEWRDPSIREGLVCDVEGRVVGATTANVFAVCGGRLVTPALHRCGVEGVARGLLLEAARGAVEVRDMLPGELMDASEVFLTNSIRGAVPVARLGERDWPVGPQAREAMARFAALGIPLRAQRGA